MVKRNPMPLRSHFQCLSMVRCSLSVSSGLGVDLSRFGQNSVRATQISTDPLRSSQSSNCSFRAIQASNLEFVCPVLRQCVHSNHALVRIIPPRCNDRSLHWPTLSVLGNRAGVVILAVCGRLRRSHRSVIRLLRSPKEDFF